MHNEVLTQAMRAQLGEPLGARWLAQGAQSMSRHVFFCVLHDCSEPTHFQKLCAGILSRLTRLSRSTLTAQPLRAFHVMARREVSVRRSRALVSTARVAHAAQRITQAIAHLPHKHRTVMAAVHGHGHAFSRVARELGISVGMTALYYEQARAMLRASGSCLNDAELCCSADMLIAQAAAHWLCAMPDRPYLCAQCAEWLLASTEHIREMLISCADQLLLTHFAAL